MAPLRRALRPRPPRRRARRPARASAPRRARRRGADRAFRSPLKPTREFHRLWLPLRHGNAYEYGGSRRSRAPPPCRRLRSDYRGDERGAGLLTKMRVIRLLPRACFCGPRRLNPGVKGDSRALAARVVRESRKLARANKSQNDVWANRPPARGEWRNYAGCRLPPAVVACPLTGRPLSASMRVNRGEATSRGRRAGAAHGQPPPEERGGDGWGQAERREIARLAPFSATSFWASQG